MIYMNKIIYALANFLRKMGYDFDENNKQEVLKMKNEILKIGGKVEFNIEQYPDGSWVAESVNIEGIITGGTSKKDIPKQIRDAVFTFFEVPPYLCNNEILRSSNEPVTVKQQVYV